MISSSQTKVAAFLTALGKRFGFDAHYFAKNSFYVTLSHILGIVRGLFTGYFVARLFDPDVYGGYRFVLHVMGIVGLVTLHGLAPAIARTVSQEDGHNAPLRWTLKIQFSLCLLCAVLLLGCIPFLSIWGRQELWPLFVAASFLMIPRQVADSFYDGIITGSSKFSRDLRLNALQSMLIIVAILPVLLWSRSAVWLLLIVIGIPTLIRLGAVSQFLRHFPSTKKDPAVLKYGFGLSVNTLIITLAFSLDALLISATFGLNQLALFSVAILLPEQVKYWWKSMLPVSFSRQARGEDTPERRAQLTRAVVMITLVSFVGVALYWIAAPLLMTILFPNYPVEQLIPLTRIASLLLLLQPSALFLQYLEARGMLKELRTAQWVSSALFASSLFYLLPTYGLAGALYSRILFRIALFGIAFLNVRRK